MTKDALTQALLKVGDELLLYRDKDKSKQQVLNLLLAYINDYKISKLVLLIFDHDGRGGQYRD